MSITTSILHLLSLLTLVDCPDSPVHPYSPVFTVCTKTEQATMLISNLKNQHKLSTTQSTGHMSRKYSSKPPSECPPEPKKDNCERLPNNKNKKPKKARESAVKQCKSKIADTCKKETPCNPEPPKSNEKSPCQKEDPCKPVPNKTTCPPIKTECPKENENACKPKKEDTCKPVPSKTTCPSNCPPIKTECPKENENTCKPKKEDTCKPVPSNTTCPSNCPPIKSECPKENENACKPKKEDTCKPVPSNTTCPSNCPPIKSECPKENENACKPKKEDTCKPVPSKTTCPSNCPPIKTECPKENENTCKSKKDTCPTKRKPKTNKKPCNVKAFKKKDPPVDPNKDGKVCQKEEGSKCKKVEMTMRALVLCIETKEVKLQQMKIPDHIKKDEVLVQVHFAGVNMTDFAVLDGGTPSCKDVLIPGREFSGVVCGAGEKVEHVKAGDIVAVAPCFPSTVCSFCVDEKSDHCVKEGGDANALGVDRNGGWAEFCVVPAHAVYKAPEGTAPKEAALLPALAQVMCSMARLKQDPCMEILILGGGLIGSLTALFFQFSGYESVTICEDNPMKVAQLEQLCTGYPIVSPSRVQCLSLDLVITNGAETQVMESAMTALKPMGQFVILGPIGASGCPPKMTINCEEFTQKQLQILGMLGSPSNPSNVSPDLACATLKGKLCVPVYPMTDYEEALSRVQTGDSGHVLLQIRPECPKCPPASAEKSCGNS